MEESAQSPSKQGDRLLHVTDDDVSQILCASDSAVLVGLPLRSDWSEHLLSKWKRALNVRASPGKGRSNG